METRLPDNRWPVIFMTIVILTAATYTVRRVHFFGINIIKPLLSTQAGGVVPGKEETMKTIDTIFKSEYFNKDYQTNTNLLLVDIRCGMMDNQPKVGDVFCPKGIERLYPLAVKTRTAKILQVFSPGRYPGYNPGWRCVKILLS